jgi:hypothetical protein
MTNHNQGIKKGTPETYRVIQWTTGNVGFHSLRAIIRHPDLELVGVFAHSQEKVGKDAGELCGIEERTGITSTNDADALLALDADCVCYNAVGETRMKQAVEELCRILSSGKNVVSTSLIFLIYPPFADRKLTEPLEEACRQGGTSLFTNGVDPGFSGDLMPLTIMGLCERVDSVHVQELFDYGSYDDPDFTGAQFGLGRPLDYSPPLMYPGAVTAGWGPMVRMVADALDVRLDEIRESHDRWVTEEAFDTKMMTVKKGTVAAIRFLVEGIVNGRPAIVAEHVNRMRPDMAPDWPKPPEGKTCVHRVMVEGSPSMTCDLEMVGYDGEPTTGGVIATALRVVNAIPAVCAAPPGLISTLDLPLITARHLMR